MSPSSVSLPLTPLSSTPSAFSIDDYLSCLQVVMVNTTLPANIGSAARAMHTMGLSRLTIVDPKLPIDESSVSHAAGGSEVLAAAITSPTLETAISDCQLVFAASSRSRHLPRPVVTPTEAAKIMLSFIDKQSALYKQQNTQHFSQDSLEAASTNNKPNIAILFGREDRGLTNEELSYADYHIQIDANPNYPVLNVASAVQVIASFIFAYAQTHVTRHDSDKDNNASLASPTLDTYVRQQWDEPAISQQQLQQLTQRMTELMIQRNLADSEHLKALPSRLSRMGSRLQLDQKEYQLLSALIAKLTKI